MAKQSKIILPDEIKKQAAPAQPAKPQKGIITISDDIKDNKKGGKVQLDVRSGVEAWLEVRGQKFDYDEARQAADFSDVMESYGVMEEEMMDYFKEDLKVGHRLFLAEKVPTKHLGAVMLNEKDERIAKVAKVRLGDETKPTGSIILV
jgi:hypothetical protein